MDINGLQDAFFSQLSEKQFFTSVFECLPGVFFLIKDTEGRFMAANQLVADRLGVSTPGALIGFKDGDFIPDNLARVFRDDDAKVLQTGEAIINRLEIWLDEQRELQWFLTNKIPLFATGGRVLGLAVIIRRYEETRSHYEMKEVSDAVGVLRARLKEGMSTEELARCVGCSERNLFRKIHKALGITPHELMLRVRVEAAAEALVSTHDPIAAVAINYGFCDQSAFTRHFKARTGQTPKQFRIRHQDGK